MPNPTPQEIAIWSKFRNKWMKKIRPLTLQTIAISEYSAKLQVLLDGLNYQANVWNDEKTGDVKQIVDAFNRIESCISKVDLQKYGLKFHDGDFDILAPVGYPDDEYQQDVVNFGFVFIIIGLGMIALGVALKVSEHLERREKIRINDQKLEIAKVLKESGAAAPEIKAAIDDFNVENESLIKESGIFGSIFGEGTGTMLAAAIGISVLLFAFLKGRK